jgi:hypothetical protein
MSLTVSVSGDHRNFSGRFNWDEAAAVWGKEAAPLGQGMLRSHAPFRTGELRQDIRYRQEAAAGERMIVFYATVPQAAWVIKGTRPHQILPRNAKALRWLGPGGLGAARFAKKVNHPGTKPNNFPERAIKPIGNAIAQMFARIVKEQMES